ncbi:hypothetical protein [Limnoglobus roseus]|uniref:SMI1/KNR4 family protein n=1 Tax=Limnoglobus roseus TaxID=2598579 RepID=A0A5C1ALM0_9BACT|nr:hypothetical protein [Limnoglobus roseus]QEL19087.1 SMI1/KNR4 family protein [Limnoglobus roseus]
MTEAEWLAANDPTPMRNFLQGRMIDRKIELVEVAQSRNCWNLLVDQRSRDLVDAAERAADGLANLQELKRIADAARIALSELQQKADTHLSEAHGKARQFVKEAFKLAAAAEVAQIGAGLVFKVCMLGFDGPELDETPAAKLTQEARNDILQGTGFIYRDIFGNPFRPVTFSPSWLTTTAVGLAEGIYADRAFDRLPILADALEDAGCENADLLNHLRSDGPHVKGCWALDLVLGKE